MTVTLEDVGNKKAPDKSGAFFMAFYLENPAKPSA
jgi:hypothetical protein